MHKIIARLLEACKTVENMNVQDMLASVVKTWKSLCLPLGCLQARLDKLRKT